MNLIAGIISIILGLAVGAVAGFFLLIALNGFTGRSGEFAIYTYLIWAILTALVAGAISFFAANYLGKTSLHKAFVFIIPIVSGFILSLIGDFIGIIISLIIAENLWKK